MGLASTGIRAVQRGEGVWRLPTAPYDLVNSFLNAGADGSLVLPDAGTRGAPWALPDANVRAFVAGRPS